MEKIHASLWLIYKCAAAEFVHAFTYDKGAEEIMPRWRRLTIGWSSANKPLEEWIIFREDSDWLRRCLLCAAGWYWYQFRFVVFAVVMSRSEAFGSNLAARLARIRFYPWELQKCEHEYEVVGGNLSDWEAIFALVRMSHWICNVRETQLYLSGARKWRWASSCAADTWLSCAMPKKFEIFKFG